MAAPFRRRAAARRFLHRLAILLFLLASAGTTRAGDRLELVMFESAACEWCDLWRDEIGPVYAKSEEGRIAPLRVVSIHTKRPADLNAIAGIVYTPTFVLWNGRREIGRILGYGGEVQFWGLLGELLKKFTKQTAKPSPPPHGADQRRLRATPIEKSH